MIFHNEKIDGEWRRKLLAQAQGKVLEVSVGSGINFRYYPSTVTVTATDLSERMIQQAKQQALKYRIKSEWLVSAIEDLKFPEHNFDTVVSTLSLCAYEDPVLILKMFNQWCKRDGTILLLEHGLSQWNVIRWFQRKMDPYYYSSAGCHLDRDIHSILFKSNLRIVKMEKDLAGIIQLIWASPLK